MVQLTVPRLDFSKLSELPDVYRQSRDDSANRQTLASLGQAVQGGQVDYTKIAGQAFTTGNAQLGMSLLQLGEQQQQRKRQSEAASDAYKGFAPMFGGQAPQAPVAPQSSGPSNAGPYANAISSIESGGRYDATGPVTRTGDRAYGKYQVMGANIGPWTQEVLGRPMTPEEFIANPQAQDAVFKAKFGAYAQKHGPEGAARAWFAGEGGMNDPNRKDILGTTVSAYADKFNRAAPQGVQVASAGGMPTPDTAAPQGPPPQQVAQAPQQPPMGGPTINGVPIAQAVPQAMRVMMNPDAPAGAKEMAKLVLSKAIESNPEIAKLEAFRRDPALMQIAINLKKAGATNVNVDQKGESKFEEEFGKKQADRWNGYMVNADAARRKMVDVNTMREISTRLGNQGAAAGIKEAIGPYADALGINVDGLSDIQAYTQVIQRLAPQQRAPGSGSTSDIEFKGFIKSLPGLSQNPVAREIGLNTMEALARDDIARGDIASKLATGEIKRDQAERELRQLPDPMKGFVEWRKANPQLYGQALKGGAEAPPPQSPPRQSAPKPDQPQPGAIEQGHRFKGGDPSKQENWEPVR